MSGYVNSWIETFTEKESPCIKTVLFDGQTGAVAGDNGTHTVDDQPAGFEIPTCAWWLIGGLFLGHLIKKNRKQQ